MASDIFVERVRNAYDRMNDWPTQPSILMWKLLIITHGSPPSNCFFVTGTTLTMPGFIATATPPDIGIDSTGNRPSGSGDATSTPPSPTDGVTPMLPLTVTPLDVL